MTLTQITEKGIKDGEIINADINASAAIAGSKIDPSFTSDVTITGGQPALSFIDDGANPDYKFYNNNGVLRLYDITNTADRLVIDSSGTVLIGNGATSRAVANVTAIQQIEGTTGTSSLSITRNSAGSAATCPRISLGRTRGTSAGGVTAVAENDIIGEIRFSGSDGNDLTNHAASISALVDGSVSNNTVPGRLEFKTATGSDPTTKMTIDSDGRVQIGSTNNSSTGTKLVIGTGNNLTATALINTQDTDINALTLSNWDGSATTNKVMMHFDSSGIGGFDVGMPAATDAFVIQDTGSSIRFRVNGDGHVDVTGHLDVGDGLDVTGGGITVNSGPANTCATFTSSDSGAVINITDNSARSSIEQNGTDLKIIADTDAGDDNSTIKFLVDNSTKMILDSSGSLRIGTGDIGTASADNLTITDSGNCGITIRSGDNDAGGIYFGDDDTSDSAHDYRGIILYDHINEGLKFYVNGNIVNHQLELKSNKDVSIVDGNLVVASGHGIDFSADSHASGMSSELLDDYEEGTFTPTVIGTVNAGTVSYSGQRGKYTKIGNRVYWGLYLSWNSTGTSGDLQIGGLPYNEDGNDAVYSAVTVGYAHNLSLSSGHTLTALTLSGNNKVYFYQYPSGGGSNIGLPYDSSASLILSGHYSVA